MAFETNAASKVASGGMVGHDGQLNVPTELENGFLDTHEPMNAWKTEMGMMLQPYELDGIESTSAMHGSARAYSPNHGADPMTTIEVQTPLTPGGGAFAE